MGQSNAHERSEDIDRPAVRTAEQDEYDGPTIATLGGIVNTMYGLINAHQRKQCQRLIALERKARERRDSQARADRIADEEMTPADAEWRVGRAEERKDGDR